MYGMYQKENFFKNAFAVTISKITPKYKTFLSAEPIFLYSGNI